MAETFGKTTKGGSSGSCGANYIHTSLYVSGSAGKLQSMGLYVEGQGTEGLVKCAIYDFAMPRALVGSTEEKAFAADEDGWMTFNFAVHPSVEAAANYKLCFWGTQSIDPWYDTGYGQYLALPYNGWPAELPAGIDTGRERSIYATYEEAPPAVKTLVQAALISIPPLIVLPTLSQILKLTGGC